MPADVPEGWNILPLSDVCKSGVFIDGDWIESKDQDPDGDVRLVQLADIGDGLFLNKSSRFMTDKAFERLKCTRLERGDVLIARMPDPIGRACIFPFSGSFVTVVDVCIARPKPEATDARWLMNAINDRRFRQAIASKATGTTRTRISRRNLGELDILLPPLPEQRRIAEILSSVDDAIAATQAVIDQTRTVKQGVLKRLLSKGIGHTRFKQTEIGEIPEEWRTAPLRDVAVVQTGLAKSKANSQASVELPYLRVANVQDGYIDLSELKTIRIFQHQISRYSLKNGDVLMTEGGDFDKLGRGDVWRGQVSPCLHQNHVFAVRPDQQQLLPDFLAALTSSDYGKSYFLKCAKRTTNLASINSTQVKEFPALLPPLAEQQKIIDNISAISDFEARSRRQVAQLQTLKSALMSDLLTGRKRVSIPEEDVAAAE